MRVRDPIHGTIEVSESEKAVVDHRFYQRLRHVRQLGFGELAFPGATHTRHAHSLGAMHVDSRVFDAVSREAELSREAAARLRAAVRVAVLCHDLGHMPLSHASEQIAPARATLRLPSWLDGARAGQASHEDFTARILLDSSLTPVLERSFSPMGVTPQAIASLVTGADPGTLGGAFTERGVDWAPLLRAIVSGELDADRMDYLLRDSFYTGVNYGRYDLDWIVGNLCAAERSGSAYLALSRAAAFAFEDFLLSRYHMFVSVYYHHTSVNFDHMLRRFYEASRGEFEIPADPEAFLSCDDVALQSALRSSHSPWARRIVARDGFKLIVQFTERDQGYDLSAMSRTLAERGLEYFTVESTSSLSKYAERGGSASLFIVDGPGGRMTDVAQYTPLYQRYSGSLRLLRLYARPDQADQARRALGLFDAAEAP